MKLGFTGESVLKMQTRLLELGLLDKEYVTADFGKMTDLALKRFQSDNGLEADGIVGALTLAKLYPDAVRIEKAVPSPLPTPAAVTPASTTWTLDNIVLEQSIIPGGSFTWDEATRGGARMPEDNEVLDGIIRIATEAQKARDLIGEPFIITSWYRNPTANANAGGASGSRHLYGDAIDFWCEGKDGDELYALLDPWWEGGLGRYSNHPALCHIDARGEVARWGH